MLSSDINLLRSDDTDARCSAPCDGRAVGGASPDGLSINSRFSLLLRSLGGLIAKSPLPNIPTGFLLKRPGGEV